MGDIKRRHGKLYIRWYDGTGKRRQKATTCRTEAQALKLLRDKEAEAEKVRDGRLEQPLGPTAEDLARRVITVRDLAARFLGDVEGEPGYAPPRIKSIDNYRRSARKNVARLPAAFLDLPVARVRLADVERVRDGLRVRRGVKAGDEQRQLAGASVVQLLAMLSKLFSWGRKMGHTDCANPVQGVERPRVAASLDFLDKPEASRLLARAEADATARGASYTARALWPMVATAIYCGLRKGEILGLRWRDVALEAGRLDVLHSYDLAPKSGKARHTPMHPELARALRWWKERAPDCEGLAFPVEDAPGRFRMGNESELLGLPEALKEAECHTPADGHPWHMLRHTYASHFVMAGGSLYELQRLLGHSTPMMTQRYAHLAPDHLAAAVARLDFTAPTPAKVSNLAAARANRAQRDRSRNDPA